GGLHVDVESAHHEELEPLELFFFSRRNDGADDLADQHGGLPAALGLGLVDATERQRDVDVRVRPRDDVDAHQLADALGGPRSGLGGGLHRRDVATDDGGDVPAADL